MKKLIIKPILCLFLILSLGGGFVGCSSKPKGDPNEVLTSYYENIKNNNITDAYNLLSDFNKSNFTEEDFIKRYKYNSQVNSFKDYKVEKINEYTNKEIDGTKYKNATEFKVIETIHDNYNDKDITHDYQRYVVNDNGNWRVYREKLDIKKDIAEAMTDLARMYAEGKGQNKDLNMAASILNEAITVNSEYPTSYYLLGATLSELRRYEESITNIQEFINKTNNEQGKSDGYNILGINYECKNDYIKAKEYYNQAIQLNSNNQYARTNLERVNKIISFGLN